MVDARAVTRSAATLHITNGDGALYLLKKAGIFGTHVAWRDALNEGPVPAGLSLEETSAVRARYLADRGHGSAIKLIHDFERRDALIRCAGDYDEVVLWFEHDLYDQLQLLQALTALEELDLEPGRISLVQSDHYLANMTVGRDFPLSPSGERRLPPSSNRRGVRGSDLPPLTRGSLRGCGRRRHRSAVPASGARAALRRVPLAAGRAFTFAAAGALRRRQGAGRRRTSTRARRAVKRRTFSASELLRVLDDLCRAEGALVEEEEGKLVATAYSAGGSSQATRTGSTSAPSIGGSAECISLPGRVNRWDDDAERFV